MSTRVLLIRQRTLLSAPTVLTRPADVSKSGDVRAFVARAVDRFGHIDAFFNNAGIIGELAPLVDYDEETFERVMTVNVRGVFLGMKHVLPHMYAAGRGSVVNCASVAGLVGHVEHGGYVASKHAVIGLTKVAGAEAAAHGVRVNAVAPGPTRTSMMDNIEAMKSPDDASAERERLMGNIPAHRYGTVDEVAETVAFLLGPTSGGWECGLLVVEEHDLGANIAHR